jgi:pimeloyl-ACP methyl ester carboxylesterase
MAGRSTTGHIAIFSPTRRSGSASSRPTCPATAGPGPAPHKWAKEDVATDVLALLDALGLDRVLLVAHDWGGYIGFLMILRAPERFDGYLALNMGYPWVTARMLLPHIGPLLKYQPLIAFLGAPVQRYTNFLNLAFKVGSALDPETACVYVDRFAIQWWRARAETPTGRSCCARYQGAHGIPKHDARPFRFVRSSVSTTPPSTNRWSRRRTPTPTTTRWRRSTPPTSSLMSARIWCGPG